MSSTSVQVWAQDLRKAVVKVTPGTSMFSVLEEACQKLKLPAEKYTLKHQKKQFQLNDAFRVTGLPPGARLELVAKSKTPTVVNIALTLPESMAQTLSTRRLTRKFRNDTTLWKMLRQFEADGAAENKRLSFTDRASPQTSNGVQAGSGQLYYEMPVLRIMNREVSTLVDFQKTLSQLGLDSGSHGIQLSFKPTQQTLSEAMQEISQFFKDEEAVEVKEKEAAPKLESPAAPVAENSAAPSVSEPSGAVVNTVTEEAPNDAAQETTKEISSAANIADGTGDAMDVDEPAAPPHDPLKPTNIFSAPTNATPAAASVDLPDSYYTPTVAHAQMHQQKLQENAVNRRLKSDAEIEAETRAEEAKIAAVKKITVKARFPDGTAAQWEFGPDDTGATLYKAVRSVMADDSAPFKIVLPGPPTAESHIKDDAGAKHKLIKGYKLSGRVLVNFVWEDSVSQHVKKADFLKPEYANVARKVEVPDIPVVEDEPETSARHQQAAPQPSSSADSGGSAKKMPKWLKGLGGKK
ncbi:hypothetical protein M406DRAFT_92365 [Cryphonectria parasitica EP155]|uniref:TUG ubiquitin-like domain-containing protein n=1 Tax=Cryphonectria parasitica (strain ATCC 38755 / EP155) TaxID=660469 RepID=A0A9P4Y9V3_CRYP1|nr:uncharacterized protein M406DRAFT_92365 [Cryphonectria parasitica EP155]KAF3769064.1 hypothetical protein M406DRAFT_92365 [Cryphonectria parasitica EP155]